MLDRLTTAISLVALVVAMAACDPFGLPSTRALENGAAGMLISAQSFELKGTYKAAGDTWTIDLQVTRHAPDADDTHLLADDSRDKVEAIVIGGGRAYYRGEQFLARHLTDPQSQGLVRAAGNAWWAGVAVSLPRLPDLTGGAAFRAAFLGPAVDRRTDHQTVGGVDAVELSGARADVYISSAAPYNLLRVRLKGGVVVDGISDADLVFSQVNTDFQIAPPRNVIDFSNVSTLPPIYTVESVDTSRCAATCLVTATVRNLGGASGASAPSTVTFTMTDPISKQALGSCTATIRPDVGYNNQTTVSCTIGHAAANAVVVTASADNPGRG
jgi:hypothetical protein